MDDIKIKCFVCFKSPLPPPNVENGPVGIGTTMGSVIEKEAVSTSKATDGQSKVIFLIKNILEIPEDIWNGFSDDFEGPRLWKNLCPPCLLLVQKARKVFAQIISLQMLYKNLQTEIKNIVLSATILDKVDNEQNRSVREIVRSYISKAMGDICTTSTNYKTGKRKTIRENGDLLITNESLTDPCFMPDSHFKNKYDVNVKSEMIEWDDYYSENDEHSNEDDVNNVIAPKKSYDVDKSKKSFVCDICGKSFVWKIHFENHLARIHKNIDHLDLSEEKKETILKKLEKEMKSRDEKRKCDICQKIFKDTSTLKKHYVTHTGEKAYQCDVCGNKFASASNLKYHSKLHTEVEKNHLCNVCGKTFISLSALKGHAIIHSNEKQFECKTCGKFFLRPATLKQHLRTHTGERPYKCSYCGKAFGTSTCLKTHVKIHTGEKPYTCEQCGKSFSEPGYLRKHAKSHGERNR